MRGKLPGDTKQEDQYFQMLDPVSLGYTLPIRERLQDAADARAGDKHLLGSLGGARVSL